MITPPFFFDHLIRSTKVSCSRTRKYKYATLHVTRHKYMQVVHLYLLRQRQCHAHVPHRAQKHACLRAQNHLHAGWIRPFDVSGGLGLYSNKQVNLGLALCIITGRGNRNSRRVFAGEQVGTGEWECVRDAYSSCSIPSAGGDQSASLSLYSKPGIVPWCHLAARCRREG